MTSLASWVGIDARGPASIYIASDSRITWGGPSRKWDSAKKTFCSLRFPIVFGFCGDVFVPTQIVSSIIELIDQGILVLSGDVFRKTSHIKSAIENMQSEMYSPEMHSYSLLIGFREGEGFRESHFDAARISFDKDASKFTFECIDLYREKSFLIFADGSGSDSIFKYHERWEKSPQGGTSRAIYSAFCDALESKADQLSGGAPQIVGLYRIGPGRLFGVMYKHNLYIGGKPVTADNRVDVIEWRDQLFQRIDPATKELFEGAQEHTRGEL
jgi:hypothetical protein